MMKDSVNTKSLHLTHKPVKLNKFVEYSFYVFLFSIPFENLLFVMDSFKLTQLSDTIGSLSRISGAFLIITSFTDLKKILKTQSSAIKYFLIYAFIYIVSFVINYPYFTYSVSLFSVLSVPWLILLFILSAGIMGDLQIRKRGMVILMFSIGLCSFLQISGYANSRELRMIYSSSNFLRLSAFDNDPNLAGAQYAIGLLLAIFVMMGMIKSGKLVRYLSILVGILSLVAMVQTGSRGAVLSFGTALITIIFATGPFKKRAGLILFVGLILIVVIELVLINEGFRLRFLNMIEFGDTAGRFLIYSSAIKLFLVQPLIGYGPFLNVHILGNELGRAIVDTHNTLLWVITANGLLGFIPFFSGLVSCGIRAFKSRKSSENIAPFSLLFLILIFSQTVSFHPSKLFWLFLAFAASSIKSPMKAVY